MDGTTTSSDQARGRRGRPGWRADNFAAHVVGRGHLTGAEPNGRGRLVDVLAELRAGAGNFDA